jgi:type IV secretory pathway VirJ component
MKRVLRILLIIVPLIAGSALLQAAEVQGPAMVHAGGRFGDVAVYKPTGPVKSVVLFVSGDGGWRLGVTDMARHLADDGALVVGIDVGHYLAQIGAAADRCVSLAADFEQLSHDVQKMLRLPGYLSPVLAGYSSGATIVYAVLAQAPPGTFAGAMSLGFCADQDFHKARLCGGLRYTVNRRGDYVLEPDQKLQDSWIALQGQQDRVCNPADVDRFAGQVPKAQVLRLPKVGHGFGVERNWLPQFREAAFQLQSFAVATAPRPSPELPPLDRLPLVEVPAAADPSQDLMAVIISGDGGWAGLDRQVATELSRRGIPGAGIDSLRYFWHARTPEETARDVASVVSHYAKLWRRPRVALIGYSFGADVLPFVVNRLPADVAARLAGIALIEPSASATFEIHVSNWLPGVETPGLDLAPELAKLRAPLLCLHGEETASSVCHAAPHAEVAQVGRGHHLGGDTGAITDRLLAILRGSRG